MVALMLQELQRAEVDLPAKSMLLNGQVEEPDRTYDLSSN
jgi:hypothetical protein